MTCDGVRATQQPSSMRRLLRSFASFSQTRLAGTYLRVDVNDWTRKVLPWSGKKS